MTTYATLRNRIMDEIDDSSIASNVNEAIQTAIKEYERKKFWFNQKTNTFSTVADQEYYGESDLEDIPNLIEIKSMKVALSGSKEDVRSSDFNWIDTAQNGLITGFPCAFAYFNKQIRLYPIPDSAYTVTMAYHYRLDALEDDDDTNAWTTDAEALIRTRAKWELFSHKLWAFDLADRMAVLEQRYLDDLQAETTRRLSNQRLATDYPGSGDPYNINFG